MMIAVTIWNITPDSAHSNFPWTGPGIILRKLSRKLNSLVRAYFRLRAVDRMKISADIVKLRSIFILAFFGRKQQSLALIVQVQ